MTQEDWSGTGAADQPSTGSLSESSFDTGKPADTTWGDSAVGETSAEEDVDVVRAVPATTRSSSRSGSRSSTSKTGTRSRSGSTPRSGSSRESSAAKSRST